MSAGPPGSRHRSASTAMACANASRGAFEGGTVPPSFAAPLFKGGRDRGACERGSGTVLAVGSLALIAMLAWAVVVAGTFVLAAHRARGVADLAALDAAGERVRGGDPCARAAMSARANGAEVVQCRVTGDEVEFAVQVRVRLRTAVRALGVPDWAYASAVAGRVK